MKKMMVTAALLVAGLAQADLGNIYFSSTWQSDADTTAGVSGMSSAGFSVDQGALGYVANGGNRVFQQSGDLTADTDKTLKADQTLVWSFDVEVDSLGADLDRGFRFSAFDNNDDGVSVRLDWGAAGGNVVQLGWKDGSVNGGAGYIGGSDVAVNLDTPVPSKQLIPASGPIHVELSVHKNNTTSINDVTLKVDDATYAYTFTGVPAFNSVKTVGYRMATTDTSDAFTISNVSMSIIPEPATLGLVAMVGAGLIGIRRFFTV